MFALLLLLHPISCLSLVLGASLVFSTKDRRSFWRTWLQLAAILAISYAAGFVEVVFNPTWIDNGFIEEIEPEKYWIWAFSGASMVQILLLPLWLVYSSLRRISGKRSGSISIPRD